MGRPLQILDEHEVRAFCSLNRSRQSATIDSTARRRQRCAVLTGFHQQTEKTSRHRSQVQRPRPSTSGPDARRCETSSMTPRDEARTLKMFLRVEA